MILADELISYPLLIKQLMAVPLSLKDYQNGNVVTKRFISHLIRTIIPNRYSLILRDDKIIFCKPNTEN